MSEPGEHNGDRMDALPGLLRIGAGAYVRTAEWALAASMRATSRLARAATSGESAAELMADVRGYAREWLGIDPRPGRPAEDGAEQGPTTRHASLRERGAELLIRSADINFEEDAHPAYERILEALAPDEGRILRFLALEGPQPAVDVRGAKSLNITTELIAPGLTMIGRQAGCRYMDRVPAYMNNLYRLGLIWFSRESLSDPLRYQVLEAQPDVVGALKQTGRNKTVRRSIHLTPFGEDFCQVCLPLSTAELEALPGVGERAEDPDPAPGDELGVENDD